MSRLDRTELAKQPTDALEARATELAELAQQAGLHDIELSADALAERQAVAEELARRASRPAR
jgi:hypothetical protein